MERHRPAAILVDLRTGDSTKPDTPGFPLPTKRPSQHATGTTVSLHGSDQAPIITFDEVSFFGVLHGIGRITLAAQVMSQSTDNGAVLSDHRVTVHLRGSLQAMTDLRNMIDKLLLVAAPSGNKAN